MLSAFSLQLICKGVLKYSLREMLGPEQRSSLFRFLDALTQLYSEKHDKLKLSELRVELNVALALMERDFPVSIQVSIFAFSVVTQIIMIQHDRLVLSGRHRA